MGYNRIEMKVMRVKELLAFIDRFKREYEDEDKGTEFKDTEGDYIFLWEFEEWLKDFSLRGEKKGGDRKMMRTRGKIEKDIEYPTDEVDGCTLEDRETHNLSLLLEVLLDIREKLDILIIRV